MIRLLISVAFALAVANSAEAMSPAPLHEPDAMVTHIADGQPVPSPNRYEMALSTMRANGICMLRSLPLSRHPRLPQVCGMERWYVC